MILVRQGQYHLVEPAALRLTSSPAIPTIADMNQSTGNSAASSRASRPPTAETPLPFKCAGKFVQAVPVRDDGNFRAQFKCLFHKQFDVGTARKCQDFICRFVPLNETDRRPPNRTG